MIVFTVIAVGLTAGLVWWFAKRKPKPKPIPAPPNNNQGVLWTFVGQSLDTNTWVVDNKAYVDNIPNVHQNYFDPNHITVSGGYLNLKLTQERGTVGNNTNGIISTGAQIHTSKSFGYGTYEWYARAATTATTPLGNGSVANGSHSGFFNYINNSETEIDMEIYGTWSDLDATVWKNSNPLQNVTSVDSEETYFPVNNMDQFHNYKFIWSANSIEYYVDDVLKATITSHVPSTPAYIYVTLLGMDSSTNLASIGVVQNLYVKWIRYTPPGATPLPVS